MHIKKEDLFKLPNILTYIRILLVPLFIYVFLTATPPMGYLYSGLIVFLSGLTDLLDGIIARKFHIITDWGKIIDPIADKLMQCAMLICLVLKATKDTVLFLSLLIIVILFVIKELVSFVVSALLYRKGKHLDGSMIYGKACTVVMYLVMILIIMFPNLSSLTRVILIAVAGAFLLMAFIAYMWEYKKMYSEFKSEKDPN
jgi:cardiolipin synthase